MAPRQCSGVRASAGERRAAPAELTRTSIGPKPASTSSTSRAASRASLQSASKPRRAGWRATAAAMLAGSREQIATAAPSARKAAAQARPMPFDPPVTSTRLPAKPDSWACPVACDICPPPERNVGGGRCVRTLRGGAHDRIGRAALAIATSAPALAAAAAAPSRAVRSRLQRRRPAQTVMNDIIAPARNNAAVGHVQNDIRSSGPGLLSRCRRAGGGGKPWPSPFFGERGRASGVGPSPLYDRRQRLAKVDGGWDHGRGRRRAPMWRRARWRRSRGGSCPS